MTDWQKTLIVLLATAVILVFAALGYLVSQPGQLPPRIPQLPTLPEVELPDPPLVTPTSTRQPVAQPTTTNTRVVLLPTSTGTLATAAAPAAPKTVVTVTATISAEVAIALPASAEAETAPPVDPPVVTPVSVIVLTPAVPVESSTLTPTPQPVVLPAPQAAPQPVWVTIPAIAVEAPVVPVGLEPSGIMQAPSRADTVGWYKFGPRPGQPSNAVLAGHLDWMGEVGVFTRLDDLQPGDTIEVQDDGGTRYRYVVESKQVYEDAAAPVAEIFGATLEPMLTLITCTGTYNKTTQTYLHRLIVRARGEW